MNIYCIWDTVFTGIYYSLWHNFSTTWHQRSQVPLRVSMPWRLEGFHSGTQIPTHLPKHCEWGLWGPSFGNLTLTTVFPLRESGFMLVRRKTTRSLQRPSFNQCTSFSALTDTDPLKILNSLKCYCAIKVSERAPQPPKQKDIWWTSVMAGRAWTLQTRTPSSNTCGYSYSPWLLWTGSIENLYTLASR